MLATDLGAADAEVMEAGNELTISVDELPQRLKAITVRSDWGLLESCRIQIHLVNNTDKTWKQIGAKGDCSCSKAEVYGIPESGLHTGEFAVAEVVYSKPKEPGITPTRIRFLIDNTPVVLPVLVEWYSPVALHKLEPVKPDTWRVLGSSTENWEIESITCLNEDVRIESIDKKERSFAVELTADVKHTRSCWLRVALRSSAQNKSFEQNLNFSLESSKPRSIPSRLICRMSSDGIVRSDARLFFPRTRVGPRPDLISTVLVLADGTEQPLAMKQKPLSKAALKVDFVSETALTRDQLGGDSTIRFKFDDKTQLDCPFLVSSE